MSLAYNFFTLPVHADPKDTERLNSFLRSVAVVAVEKQFVADGQRSFWSVCVEYQENVQPEKKSGQTGRARVDYGARDGSSPLLTFAKQ